MKAQTHPTEKPRGVRDPVSCKVQSGGKLVFIRNGQPEFWSDRPFKFETHIRLLLGEYRVKRGGKPVQVRIEDIKWKQLGSSTWWRIPAWPDGIAEKSINRETSHQRWVRRTRESVHRAMSQERIPVSAGMLEGNLDITWWSSIGPMDHRTRREISAALNWMVREGFASVLPDDERDPYDPPGKLYVLTVKGWENVPAKEEKR